MRQPTDKPKHLRGWLEGHNIMTVWQGVIVTATGDLVRAGYVDFDSFPDFECGTESVRTDVLQPAFVKNTFNGVVSAIDPDFDKFHRWNGSSWITVANNIGELSRAAFNLVKTLNFTDLTTTGTPPAVTKVEYYKDSARTLKLFTKDLTYNVSNQLTLVTLTREEDSQTFTETLTYVGNDVSNVDYA